MKNIKKGKFLSPIAMAMIFILSSCGNKDTVTPATPTGTFLFHLHTDIDSSEVAAYNTVYTTRSGRKISLSLAQLYISGIQLVKLDGSTVDLTGKKILKTFESEDILVGDAPVGNYKSVRFKVGLDATTNALNASKDSLLNSRQEMWFSSASQPDGYIFLNVQGTIDTSSTLNKPLVPFVYKIGTNANYTQISMEDKNFTIVEGKAVFSHININYRNLFTGITLHQTGNLSVTTASANSSALALKIVNNISSMFSYEQ